MTWKLVEGDARLGQMFGDALDESLGHVDADVGVDFRAIETDSPEFKHVHFLGQFENLQKQVFDLGKKRLRNVATVS